MALQRKIQGQKQKLITRLDEAANASS